MDVYEHAKRVYEEWMANPFFDAGTHNELKRIADSPDEITDRFYSDLKFGTAGLRGVIGAGTNRMNCYTVRRATQGLARYIRKTGNEGRGVAIAYDSRRMSREFALETALCLCANGIKVFLFDELRPTPELSFAVRHLGCVSAVNITASHNPPEYNGYKVYWDDGAQVTPPHDEGIMAEVAAVTDYADALMMDEAEAREKGLLITIGSEIDDAFIAACKAQIREPEAIRREAANIRIVYTPLNGAGNILMRRLLSELGFAQVYVVKEQEEPDGNFPTLEYPNPEDPKAFTYALKLAREVDADLVMATDPDSDRIGLYVKDGGDYRRFNGNMTGCFLADYELGRMKAHGSLPAGATVISTVVSSRMTKAIAENYGVKYVDTLTGFKNIGGVATVMERDGSGTYVYGFEESFGYLIGSHARDKDAIVTGMALCEAAAYYRTQGMSLWDAMTGLYDRMGYYLEGAASVVLKGVDGQAKIAEIMRDIRAKLPQEINGSRVIEVSDFSVGTCTDTVTGEVKALTQPRSDVLVFMMEDGSWSAVRPSGTEPKIKYYDGVIGSTSEDAAVKEKHLSSAMAAIISEAEK